MTSILPRVVLTFALVAVGGLPLRAQVWSGSADNLWGNAANWGGTVPGAGGVATFDSAGNGNTAISIGGSATPILSILFDTPAAAAYTFSGTAGGAFVFDNGGSVTTTSAVT